MSARWLLGALAAGLLLSIAAVAAERVAGWFRLPRRWIWAAAMGASLLIPAVTLLAPGTLPRLLIPVPRRAAPLPHPAAAVPGLAATAEPEAPPPSRLPAAFAALWLAASLGTLGTFAWAVRRVRRACGPCVPRRVHGERVLLAERMGPAVVGLLDPHIVLPRWALEVPEGELRLILRHEREHVDAGDHWLLAFATLAVALLPWSAALWWQHRRLRLAVETDCDARVLARGASRGHYGRMLLDMASRPLLAASPALAWGGRPSHLERRIQAMTTQPPRHRVLRALPLAGMAAIVAAAACGVAADAPQPAAADAATRTETWHGKTVTTTERADGSTQVAMTDPRAAFTGFAWNVEPITVTAGQPLPRRTQRYPVVARVIAGSNAERAGLMVGDVIVRSNGRDARELPLLPQRRPGAEYTLRIRRGTGEHDVHVVLGPAGGGAAQASR
jgi:hypothetical protein